MKTKNLKRIQIDLLFKCFLTLKIINYHQSVFVEYRQASGIRFDTFKIIGLIHISL